MNHKSRFHPIVRCWLVIVALTLSIAPPFARCAEPDSTPWKPLTVPKALIVVGPWGDMFRWRESLHLQGIMYDDGYREQNGYHRPSVKIVGMPADFERYLDYSCVVLINIDALALGHERLASLQRFVRQGGGLVVMGGSWAYSRGAYGGTALEEMLPVTFPPQHRIPASPEGNALAPAASSAWAKDIAFDQNPRAYYVQDLVPKPNAVVELRAGEQPAFISGAFGAGRVVACGLTVHGKSPDKPSTDSPAFWDWSEWPKVLGHFVEWAALNRPLRPTTNIESEVLPLTDDEIQQVRLQFQGVRNEFVVRFTVFPSATAANTIFERLVDGKDFQATLSPAAIGGLAQFAQPAWHEPLVKLADDANPDRVVRAAALELLGATHVPSVSKILLSAINDNDVAPAAINGLRRLNDPTHIPAILSRFEQCAELSDFRNPDNARASGPIATRNGAIAIQAAIALYALGEPEGVNRMVTLYREIQLLRRIHANAAKRRVSDTDPTGIAIRKAIYERHGDLMRLETQLLNAAGPVPAMQRKAFVKTALTADDVADIRWLANGLLHSPADSDWSALAQTKDGILRRVGQAKAKK